MMSQNLNSFLSQDIALAYIHAAPFAEAFIEAAG